MTITTNRPLFLRALFVPLEENGTKTQTFCVNVSILFTVIRLHYSLRNVFWGVFTWKTFVTYIICLIVVITCSIEVINGNISSSCRGMMGEKCDVICGSNALIKTVPIVCLSSGDWDKETSVVCREQLEFGNLRKFVNLYIKIHFFSKIGIHFAILSSCKLN